MRLHVLTACSRPGLLPTVAQSIADARCDPWEVCWHVRFDLERQHVGGQALKNQMLDQIDDGWVCFLDDDTLMHPDLLSTVAEDLSVKAVVVSQDRTDGRRLHAAREHLQVGLVDIGQAVIRRRLIANHRIPESYEGDGMFLEQVLRDTPAVRFVDEVLSLHNALEMAA